MGERSIAVELTESEICEVKTWADLVHLLEKVQHGPEPWNAPNRIIEMKMLKALDAIQAKTKEEAIPMTFAELKTVRALVEGGRDSLLMHGSKATLELDSLMEKLDAAARRIEQKECQELRGE